MKSNIIIAQVIFIFSIVGCSGGHKESLCATDNASFAENVKTVEVSSVNQETELTLAGKVEYDPDRIINYVSPIHGLVERVYFSLGDKVQKGQTLFDIRSSDLSALQSELLAQEAELDVARRALMNAQSMYDDKMVSDKDLLEAKAKFRQTEAAYERARNDMSSWHSRGDGTFSILAPMSGYIVGKQVASGSPVSTESSPLFVIADLSKVWITANVYASDLTQVQENMLVEITALAYPGETFEGKINAMSQVFDPEEKVLKARIAMTNANLKFKPEMAVLIRLKNKTAIQRLAVPSNSVIFDDNKYFVVVEEETGKYSVRHVELAGSYDQLTYISKGLKNNEKVVIENQLLIYESMSGK
ncbi:MAG: efflux RND transporter periplasmic adaptor subunit [Dysgonamonadaceae bacterium]|nr:efflux RND transporter periplasmic adaptor subunit [Dysgonamonadaceae bacterium]